MTCENEGGEYGQYTISRLLETPWIRFILCVCTIGKKMLALLYGDQEIHLGIETHLSVTMDNLRSLFLKNSLLHLYCEGKSCSILDLQCFLFKVAHFPVPSLRPVDSPSCLENPQVVSSESYFIFVSLGYRCEYFTYIQRTYPLQNPLSGQIKIYLLSDNILDINTQGKV